MSSQWCLATSWQFWASSPSFQQSAVSYNDLSSVYWPDSNPLSLWNLMRNGSRCFGCRECLLSFTVEICAKRLWGLVLRQSWAASRLTHSNAANVACAHVNTSFVLVKEIIHRAAEIFSKEVCSLRLFSGNEVDTYLSSDSVCVSPLKWPVCGFGGK